MTEPDLLIEVRALALALAEVEGAASTLRDKRDRAIHRSLIGGHRQNVVAAAAQVTATAVRNITREQVPEPVESFSHPDPEPLPADWPRGPVFDPDRDHQ